MRDEEAYRRGRSRVDDSELIEEDDQGEREGKEWRDQPNWCW